MPLSRWEPSPAGRLLAGELRGIRERTGLSGDAAATRLGWSASKVCRFELAKTCMKPEDAGKLLALYKVPGDRTRALTALAVRAWGERDLEESGRFAVTEVLAWAPSAVPLILRTAGYHAAVLGTIQQVAALSPGAIREAVKRNALWQERLAGDTPLTVRAVLDETVLHRAFGSRAVMAAQIGRLAGLDGMDHVDLRVLPLAAGGPSHLPPFTYTKFDGAGDDLPSADEAEVATLAEPWAAVDERTVWLHHLAFGQLAEAAEPAADHLRKALAEWGS